MYSTYLTLFDNFGILRKVGLWVRDIQYHPMIVGQDIFAAAANLRSICPHFCDGAKSRTQPDSVGLSRTQLENTEVDIKQVGNFLGEAWLADFDGCVWVTDLMGCTQCALCIISIHRPTYQAVSLSLSPCMKSQHLSQMEWPPGPQDLCFIKGLLSNGILRVLDSVQGISLQGLPQTTLPILNMKTWESSCDKPSRRSWVLGILNGGLSNNGNTMEYLKLWPLHNGYNGDNNDQPVRPSRFRTRSAWSFWIRWSHP